MHVMYVSCDMSSMSCMCHSTIDHHWLFVCCVCVCVDCCLVCDSLLSVVSCQSSGWHVTQQVTKLALKLKHVRVRAQPTQPTAVGRWTLDLIAHYRFIDHFEQLNIEHWTLNIYLRSEILRSQISVSVEVSVSVSVERSILSQLTIKKLILIQCR